MTSGSTSFSCTAGYATGGLGQHLAQLVEEARQRGELNAYYCTEPLRGDAHGRRVVVRGARPVMTLTPIRFSPGWRTYVDWDLFDRAVASRVQRTSRFVGFSGQALRTFHTVQAEVREILSPTAHVDRLWARYQEASRAHPIEGTWLNGAGRRKAKAEYGLADTIKVSSEYARESFLDAGLPLEKLARVEWKIPSRFKPGEERPRDGIFRVVYVGSLTITKGIPVLLDAFAALRGDCELTLVGGWATRGMRKYLHERVANDPRIRLEVGDPLPALRSADVLAHPSFSDGFGYAPMEALACGLPVVVTEDTGMKEFIREGINGWIVPTGDSAALLERLEHVRRYPLKPTVTARTPHTS